MFAQRQGYRHFIIFPKSDFPFFLFVSLKYFKIHSVLKKIIEYRYPCRCASRFILCLIVIDYTMENAIVMCSAFTLSFSDPIFTTQLRNDIGSKWTATAERAHRLLGSTYWYCIIKWCYFYKLLYNAMFHWFSLSVFYFMVSSSALFSF